MSGYNDGSSFGYDEISPYDHIPITFEQISLPSGTQFLASENEFPRFSRVDPTTQIHQITDQSLVKKLSTPADMVEGFTNKKLDKQDIQLILIFIVIIVGILQIKMMISIDKMNFVLQMQMPLAKRSLD